MIDHWEFLPFLILAMLTTVWAIVRLALDLLDARQRRCIPRRRTQ